MNEDELAVDLPEVEEMPVAPRGKSAYLSKLKESEPDYEPEDDDALFDRAIGQHEELGRHKNSNSRINELVAKDPRMGAVLSMVAEGKSYPYAHAKVFGKEALELEGDDLEQWEQGYQENMEQMGASKAAQEEAQKNIEQYKMDLDSYCEGKDENEKMTLNDKIYEIADNMLNGIIPKDVIELIDKGLTKDEDVQDAYDTGKAEGRNQKIDRKMKKPDMPDMMATTKAKTRNVMPQKDKDFYSELS